LTYTAAVELVSLEEVGSVVFAFPIHPSPSYVAHMCISSVYVSSVPIPSSEGKKCGGGLTNHPSAHL
jgi:hypothetical protein